MGTDMLSIRNIIDKYKKSIFDTETKPFNLSKIAQPVPSSLPNPSLVPEEGSLNQTVQQNPVEQNQQLEWNKQNWQPKQPVQPNAPDPYVGIIQQYIRGIKQYREDVKAGIISPLKTPIDPLAENLWKNPQATGYLLNSVKKEFPQFFNKIWEVIVKRNTDMWGEGAIPDETIQVLDSGNEIKTTPAENVLSADIEARLSKTAPDIRIGSAFEAIVLPMRTPKMRQAAQLATQLIGGGQAYELLSHCIRYALDAPSSNTIDQRFNFFLKYRNLLPPNPKTALSQFCQQNFNSPDAPIPPNTNAQREAIEVLKNYSDELLDLLFKLTVKADDNVLSHVYTAVKYEGPNFKRNQKQKGMGELDAVGPEGEKTQGSLVADTVKENIEKNKKEIMSSEEMEEAKEQFTTLCKEYLAPIMEEVSKISEEIVPKLYAVKNQLQTKETIGVQDMAKQTRPERIDAYLKGAVTQLHALLTKEGLVKLNNEITKNLTEDGIDIKQDTGKMLVYHNDYGDLPISGTEIRKIFNIAEEMKKPEDDINMYDEFAEDYDPDKKFEKLDEKSLSQRLQDYIKIMKEDKQPLWLPPWASLVKIKYLQDEFLKLSEIKKNIKTMAQQGLSIEQIYSQLNPQQSYDLAALIESTIQEPTGVIKELEELARYDIKTVHRTYRKPGDRGEGYVDPEGNKIASLKSKLTVDINEVMGLLYPIINQDKGKYSQEAIQTFISLFSPHAKIVSGGSAGRAESNYIPGKTNTELYYEMTGKTMPNMVKYRIDAYKDTQRLKIQKQQIEEQIKNIAKIKSPEAETQLLQKNKEKDDVVRKLKGYIQYFDKEYSLDTKANALDFKAKKIEEEKHIMEAKKAAVRRRMGWSDVYDIPEEEYAKNFSPKQKEVYLKAKNNIDKMNKEWNDYYFKTYVPLENEFIKDYIKHFANAKALKLAFAAFQRTVNKIEKLANMQQICNKIKIASKNIPNFDQAMHNAIQDFENYFKSLQV
jgi:hypothetical protein